MNTALPHLDAEQTTALSQLAAKFDTPELWASTVLVALIDEQVIRNINAKGAQLLEVAKQLPKEKRLDFTTQAETLLQTIAQQA